MKEACSICHFHFFFLDGNGNYRLGRSFRRVVTFEGSPGSLRSGLANNREVLSLL